MRDNPTQNEIKINRYLDELDNKINILYSKVPEDIKPDIEDIQTLFDVIAYRAKRTAFEYNNNITFE